MSEEPNDNSLDDNLRDKLVALGKGAAGLIPMVGGPLAEIIGVIIPGQRADRIAAYLRALAARIDVLSAEIKASIASNAERIALIEEGGYQAARATSPERIAQIVEAVSRGLEADDVDAIRRRCTFGFRSGGGTSSDDRARSTQPDTSRGGYSEVGTGVCICRFREAAGDSNALWSIGIIRASRLIPTSAASARNDSSRRFGMRAFDGTPAYLAS